MIFNIGPSVGKMPPRKPTTRHSLGTRKIKELEFGEGYMMSTARVLDFSSRTELVIRTSTKMNFTQPLAFNDTEERKGSKGVLPY